MTRFSSPSVRKGLCRLVLLVTLAPGVVHAAEETIDLTLDKAKILRMPPNAQTIVIGNPIIADVTAIKTDGLVVLTGKGFGETNMIFLDAAGKAVEETSIRVRAATALVTVQRGMDRESYSCRPRCEPTVSLGDANTFMRDASAQITSRNTLATPASH